MSGQVWTADSAGFGADSATFMADGGIAAPIPAGWPCADLPGTPPSVADKQSHPTADEILPQILALTPRGPAWGRDEAGSADGSPVMRSVWRALAGWVADANRREHDLASQALPSAATWSLPDWEREYGLPDACTSAGGGTEARMAAVRARFAGIGGQSPAYYVCLAQSLGYAVTIEEPTQFLVDVSELAGGDIVESWFTPGAVPDEGGALDGSDLAETWLVCDDGEIGPDGQPIEGYALAESGDGDALEGYAPGAQPDEADEVAGGLLEDWFAIDDGVCDDTPLESARQDPQGSLWKFWVVHVQSQGETFFRIDEGEVDRDPLEGFGAASDLECALRRLAPQHTELLFRYAAWPDMAADTSGHLTFDYGAPGGLLTAAAL